MSDHDEQTCPACKNYAQTEAAARDAARVRNETRDRLDALDDAATQQALARLLTDAPDLTRQLLAAAADLDVDAVRDALNETGN